jgi:uncharacterized protein
VTVVSDSSPLIILTKLGCFGFLNRVFPRLLISPEVHYEVVTAGAGLPGASEVSKAEWIEVKAVQNPAGLHSAQRNYGLGPGEMSTILLAKELGGNPVLTSISDCWIVVCDPWAFLLFKPGAGASALKGCGF